MLPLKNRLKKKKDIERVFKEGKGVKESFLILRVVKNNLEVSRFGFVIGKSFSNKATLRNKIKRKMREVVRLKLPEIKGGIDGVFIVLPSHRKELSMGDGFKGVKETMGKLLKKSAIFKS